MSEIENSLSILIIWEINRKAILNTDTDFQTLEEIEVQKGDIEDDFDQGQEWQLTSHKNVQFYVNYLKIK